jgi:hypothetical protein
MDVPSDTCVLIADHGIGDHYIVAGFAEAVARQHRVRIRVAGRRDLRFVADLFPAVDFYLDMPPQVNGQSLSADNVTGGRFFYAHFPQFELMRAVGYKDFHFLDAYRCRLQLPAEAQLSAARLPNANELDRARHWLEQHQATPGRTVILNIDARSISPDFPNADFWTTVADELRTHGYEPLVNQGPQTEVPIGLNSASIPLAEYRAIAMAAGRICSLRCGVSDLICDLPCPQVVVYPDIDYWGGPLLRGTGFTGFDLSQPPLEILARRENSELDARTIGRHFAEHAASLDAIVGVA